MKIITQDNQFSVDTNTRKISNKNEKETGFDEILNASIKKTNAEKLSESSETLSYNSNIRPMENFSKLSLVQLNPSQILSRDQLVNKIDTFLNLLEDYATKLEDSKIDMHEIHPLVRQLKKENNELRTQLSHLDKQDHLTYILENAIETSEKELMNFDKGHYVSIIQ